MSLNVFKAFATDLAKEESGVEVQIGDEAFITVARAGNKSYGKLLTSQFEANKHALDRKDAAADKLAESIVITTMAKTLLLGWRGLTDEQDQPLDYNYANAVKLLEMKDFRMLVSKQAEDFKNFRKFTEDADAKN